MLLSFIATIENGFSMSAEVTEAQKAASTSEGSGQGGAGTGEIVSALGLKLDASGKYSRTSGDDRSAEQRFKKEHTAASLFNRLYSQLSESNLVTEIANSDNLQAVKIGDIVEIVGVISENPAEQILRTMDRFLPFVSKFAHGDAAEQPTPNRDQRRNLSRAQREQLERETAQLAGGQGSLNETAALVELLRKDLKESPIVDLTLKSKGVSAILTASREFFSQESAAMLVGGTFYALGKVTGVNDDPDSDTKVMRRGAVAGMSPVVDGFVEFGKTMGSMLDLPPMEISLHGRSLQIIPLAIFI